MTLGISKAYTPAYDETSDESAYNTDIATLFNAFSGLEAQTSTLGALTITPSANSTTIFQITNAAGTELLSADTTNSCLKLKATAKLYLDGGSDTYITEQVSNTMRFVVGGNSCLDIFGTSGRFGITNCDLEVDATQKIYLDEGGNTYIQESAADILDIYVGGLNMIKLTEAATDKVEILGADLEIDATKKLYLDGGGNTYIQESAADTVSYVVGGVVVEEMNSTTGGTGGTGSAGAGNQYVELKLQGVRYKLLHDGAIT